MTITDDTPCVFNPRTKTVVDFIREPETEAQALTRLAGYGPDLVVMPFGQAWRAHEDAAKTEPMEIPEERFHEMLNVLPPVSWHNTSDGESFKLSERTTGSITAIFVNLNGRFFEFSDDIRTPHRECCGRVFHSPAYKAPPERRWMFWNSICRTRPDGHRVAIPQGGDKWLAFRPDDLPLTEPLTDVPLTFDTDKAAMAFVDEHHPAGSPQA